jgi:hypothetical protein
LATMLAALHVSAALTVAAAKAAPTTKKLRIAATREGDEGGEV